MMPGASDSTGLVSVQPVGPLPSMGWPRAFTMRPIMPSPTGTDTTLPVRITFVPSRIFSESESMTMATVCSSRFMAMPNSPPSNRTSSFAMQLSRPKARTMPSPTVMTVPVSASAALFS